MNQTEYYHICVLIRPYMCPHTTRVCGQMNQTAVDTSHVGAVRLKMVKRATGWGYSLWEMEVLGEC